MRKFYAEKQKMAQNQESRVQFTQRSEINMESFISNEKLKITLLLPGAVQQYTSP